MNHVNICVKIVELLLLHHKDMMEQSTIFGNYEQLTRPQLQHLAEERGLNIQGDRDDLIQQLIILDQTIDTNKLELGEDINDEDLLTLAYNLGIRPEYMTDLAVMDPDEEETKRSYLIYEILDPYYEANLYDRDEFFTDAGKKRYRYAEERITTRHVGIGGGYGEQMPASPELPLELYHGPLRRLDDLPVEIRGELDEIKELAEERGLDVDEGDFDPYQDEGKIYQRYLDALDELDRILKKELPYLDILSEDELLGAMDDWLKYASILGLKHELIPKKLTPENRQDLLSFFRGYWSQDVDPQLLSPEGHKTYKYAQTLITRKKGSPKLIPNYHDRVKGMFWGCLLGDSLGGPHEFKQSLPVSQYTGHLEYPVKIPSRFQGVRYGTIGQWSDDTEMTLALANSLLRKKGYDRDDVILSYQEWANSKPMGMGKNTRRLLQGVKTIKGFEQRYQKALREDLTKTQSNGSLMRASPLALLVNPDDFDTFQQVLIDTQLTNPNRVNEEASLIYVMALAMALRGKSVDEILDEITNATAEMDPLIQEVVDEVNSGEIRDIKPQKGWVLHSLYSALWGIRLYQQNLDERDVNPFKIALNEIIRLGGDTDTNGAIFGALGGALAGYQELDREEGTNIDILLNVETQDGDFPRPDLYHPRTLDRLVTDLVTIFPLK